MTKTFAKVQQIEKVWLTSKEAQKYLGVSKDFLAERRRRGEIPFFQYGNKQTWFRKHDLDRFILRNKVI